MFATNSDEHDFPTSSTIIYYLSHFLSGVFIEVGPLKIALFFWFHNRSTMSFNQFSIIFATTLTCTKASNEWEYLVVNLANGKMFSLTIGASWKYRRIRGGGWIRFSTTNFKYKCLFRAIGRTICKAMNNFSHYLHFFSKFQI